MPGKPFYKGVYCLECEWLGYPRLQYGIQHLLRLIDQLSPPRYDHFHYDVSTAEEFWFLLRRWTQKRFNSHPILYLAFHGKPGAIYLRSGARSPVVTLDEIRDELAGRCNGRVIFFGSCETMYNRPWERRKFLETTQALAICGYKREIPWMLSAAMDLIVLSAMQEHAFDLQGMRAIAKRIKERSRGLQRALGFRIYTRQGEA